MTCKFIVVQDSFDGTSMPVDTPEQIEVALAAMRNVGQEIANVYFGDPEDPDSYASGRRLIALNGVES